MACFDGDIIEVEGFVANSARVLFEENGDGEILMVNSAGIYVGTNNKVFLICDSSWGYVPAGIAIDDFRGLTNLLNLRSGEGFSYSDGLLKFSSAKLKIVAKYASRRIPQVLRPQKSLIEQAALELADLKKTRGLSMLSLPIVLEDQDTEALSVNPFCERACRGILDLLDALKNENTEKMRNAICGLLGLGVGLTPSADDVMMGMLYVFRELYDGTGDTVRAFVDELPMLCDDLTNAVSASYIKAIYSGDIYERADRVLGALCGEADLKIAELTEVGGSSGCEMLLGILCALKILC